jgi:hypothetical protein
LAARLHNPAGAETAAEALAYIRACSRAGRTHELAALLRRSPVFREAWQTLQQSSYTASEPAGGRAALASAPERPAPAAAASPGWLPNRDPAALPLGPAPEFFSTQPAAPAHLQPAPNFTPALAAVCQVYGSQESLFTRKAADRSRITVRV